MRNRKRLFSILLATMLLIGIMPVTAMAVEADTDGTLNNPAVFSDMPDNWSRAALENAVANGLLAGSGGKLMPNDNLTRAQMAAVIVQAFGANSKGDLKNFSDIKSSDWYADSMAKAYQMGVIKGSNGTMNPNSPITRQEVFVILSKALKMKAAGSINKSFTDLNEIADWARGDVYAMVNSGYVNGSGGKLNPKGLITRAEFAQIMDNIIKQYIRSAGVYTTVANGNIMVNTPGVTLKDLKVNGDLIIGDGVGDGEVILDGVHIAGRMVVRGGGENSIIIRGNSSIARVIVSRVDGVVSIKVEGDADVEVIYIDDGSDDVNIEGTVGHVEIQASDIVVTARGAAIDQINISGRDSRVIIDKDSKVNAIDIQQGADKVEVTVAGTVTNITTTGSDTVITGTGTVKKVEAKDGATGTRIQTPNTTIVVAEGVTGVTGGGGVEIKGGTTVTNNPTGSGVLNNVVTGGGGGGSSRVFGVNKIEKNPDETQYIKYDDQTEVAVDRAARVITIGGVIPCQEKSILGHEAGSNLYELKISLANVKKETAAFKSVGTVTNVYSASDNWMDGDDYFYYIGKATLGVPITITIDNDGNWDTTNDAISYTIVIADDTTLETLEQTNLRVINSSQLRLTGETPAEYLLADVLTTLFGLEAAGTESQEIASLFWFNNYDYVNKFPFESTDVVEAALAEAKNEYTKIINTLKDGESGEKYDSKAAALESYFSAAARLAGTLLDSSRTIVDEIPEISNIYNKGLLTVDDVDVYIAESLAALINDIDRSDTDSLGAFLELVNEAFFSFEPNDNMEQAAEIAVGVSKTVWIYPETDVDWFKFVAEVGKLYTITTSNLYSPTNDMDTYLYLYDENGVLLAEDDDGGDISYESRIIWLCLARGVYYIKVVHYENNDDYGEEPDQTAIGRYDIAVSEIDIEIHDEVENGDFETGNFDGWTVESAGEFPIVQSDEVNSGSYAAYLGDGAEGMSDGGNAWTTISQYIKIKNEGEIPSLNISYLVEGSDFGNNALVVAINGIGIDHWQNDSDGWKQFTYDLSAYSGQVILLEIACVTMNGEGELNCYVDDINISYEDTSSGEPNNTPEEAAEIVPGEEPQTHWIYPSVDEDWFSFEAEAGKHYHIETSSLFPDRDRPYYMVTAMTLYDAGETEINYSDSEEKDGSSIFYAPEVDGTYYIKVVHKYSEYSEAIGRYDIAVSEIDIAVHDEVENGGFETGGFDGWIVKSAKEFPKVQGEKKNSGNYAAYMGDGADGMSDGGNAWTTISQFVKIKNTEEEENPRLYISYLVEGSDEGYDWLEVRINGDSIVSWSEDSDGWKQFTYDLSDYRGKVILLEIICMTEDSQYKVDYYVDDISISYGDIPIVTKSIVTRDPGNTGGGGAIFDEATNTFSGTIAYYEAAEGFPPVAGNYVGVKITAPEGVVVDTEKATFRYTNASGEEITLTGTWLDGENFVYYYPKVIAEKRTFTVVIDWDGSGTVYGEETITIVVAGGAILDSAPEEPEKAYEEQLSEATDAVVAAETSKDQGDVDAARALVAELREADKTALNLRLDDVQVIIDAAPAAETLTPIDGAVNVALDATVRILLDQDVTVNNLSGIKIEYEANGLHQVADVVGTLDGRTIEITHAEFANCTEYTVIIPADAVINSEAIGNGEITWCFTTEYIQVATAADLDTVRNNLGGKYVQVADIDLSSYSWEPVGRYNFEFSGTYNGNGFKISNLNVNGEGDLGLFGAVTGTIENVVLENVSVTGSASMVGGLAGSIANGKIKNSHVQGTVTGKYAVGLLAGYSYESMIESCSVAGYVYGGGTGYRESIGGLVGRNIGTIEKSFAAVEVYSDLANSYCVGGLVGNNGGGTIKQSYVTGEVTSSGAFTGGLVGDNRDFNGQESRIIECYAVGQVTGSGSGGLVGLSEGLSIIEKSYYDQETAQKSDIGKGIPKSTGEMKQQTTFIDWDFDDVWVIDEGETYPYLQWQGFV